MRVLFVTHNIPRVDGDAAGSFVLRLAVALQASGARVDVIAPSGAGAHALDCIEGVNISRVRYATDKRMTLAYSGTMADAVRSSWSARFALLGLLKALRRATIAAVGAARVSGTPYDVVHVHWWFPSGLALWRAFRHGAPPIVLTMHGSDVRLAQRVRPAHAIMRAVLKTASVRTAVSTWLAEIATRLVGGLDVQVAPMPVDDRYFDVAHPGGAMGKSGTRNGVLFVGRLNAQKGLAHLITALAQPALRDASLDVVGEGPDKSALYAQATSLGVLTRIRWHGAQPPDALAQFYRRAMVVAMPSSEEGLGLVAVEAQLCGTPVVAFASGGLRDVVCAAWGGTLVPVRDTTALAAAIAKVLSITPDEATQNAMRNAMRKRFAPSVVASRYLALYAEAINGPAE